MSVQDSREFDFHLHREHFARTQNGCCGNGRPGAAVERKNQCWQWRSFAPVVFRARPSFRPSSQLLFLALVWGFPRVFGFVGSGKKKNPEKKTEYRGNQQESDGEQLGFGFFGYGGRREKEKSC